MMAYNSIEDKILSMKSGVRNPRDVWIDHELSSTLWGLGWSVSKLSIWQEEGE